MTFSKNFIKYLTHFVLSLCILIAIGLHVFKLTLPCFNADEAAFSYNAYSIAQTARDEYGDFLPFRFTSFGDNKLPMTFYTIVPFVKMFGLNEISARLPFMLMGIAAPILFYLLAKELFKNKYTALTVAFLSAISPWIHIAARHVHEDTLILTLSLLTLLFIVKLVQSFSYRYLVIIAVLIGLSFFTYHIGKVLGVYFFLLTLISIFIHKKRTGGVFAKSVMILLIPVCIFGITELLVPPTRVSNLLFFKNDGFQLALDEKLRENPVRSIHNKGTSALITLSHKYLTYFSPEFLVLKGDENKRFGFPGISPISPIEYVMFLVGLYYLFKNKQEYRFIVVSFLLVSPLSASLAWPEYSLTRSFTGIIPILLLAGYGSIELLKEIRQNKYRYVTASAILGGIIFFTFFSWEFYFFHYFKRGITAYAWQCGYKELNSYIQENYDDFDRFYITRKHGQPYIFTLFYSQYSPKKYQSQAKLSAPDEYGFGQVEAYDKFKFEFKTPFEPRSVYIGYPDDFLDLGIPESQIKKIAYDDEVIFWIYEKRK